MSLINSVNDSNSLADIINRGTELNKSKNSPLDGSTSMREFGKNLKKLQEETEKERERVESLQSTAKKMTEAFKKAGEVSIDDWQTRSYYITQGMDATDEFNRLIYGDNNAQSTDSSIKNLSDATQIIAGSNNAETTNVSINQLKLTKAYYESEDIFPLEDFAVQLV